MARTRYASLLDDPTFATYLDQLEVTGPPAELHPVSEWFVEPSPPRLWPDGDTPWLGVVAFLVMMGLGGAAAAYVFADRVALILASARL